MADAFSPFQLQHMQQTGYTGQIRDANGNNTVWTNGVMQPLAAGAAGAPGAAGAAGAQPAPAAPPPLTQQGGYMGGGQDPHQMTQWGGWSNVGGVNPAGWQQLGNGPDLSFLSNFNTQGQIAPTTAGSLQGAAQPYVDSAYSAATRELDPQWQANQNQFNQQMVNQGLAPGSAAYQAAQDNFNRSKDDAYNQARNSAQTQGLAAQAQGFGQGLSQSQLQSQLAQALLGSQTGIANQQLGGNASIMNALLGGNSGIAQQLIGGAATTNAANASSGAARYAAGLNNNIQQQQIDNGMLMSLLGMGQGQTQYNNGLLNADQQRNQSFFPYMPSGAGNGPMDVQNPYNNQYNGQMNQWGYQNQQANAQNGMWANLIGSGLGMFMMCSHAFKKTLGPLEPAAAMDAIRGLPVDRWSYHGENEVHIGTYAEEFNKAMDLSPKPVIDPIDMLGAILAAVKSLDTRMSALEAKHG